MSPRFLEAVHGKKHLDNFQNKTKLLCRHLEFNNVNITHWFLETWLLWYFLYDDNEPQNQTIKIEHKKTWTGVREKQTPATGVQLYKLWQQLATRNSTALPCQSHLLSSRLRIELTSLAKHVVHFETGATAMHDAVDTEAGESYWSTWQVWVLLAEGGDCLAMFSLLRTHWHLERLSADIVPKFCLWDWAMLVISCKCHLSFSKSLAPQNPHKLLGSSMLVWNASRAQGAQDRGLVQGDHSPVLCLFHIFSFFLVVRCLSWLDFMVSIGFSGVLCKKGMPGQWGTRPHQYI